MEELLSPTPYDITDIPHFQLTYFEILIPIFAGLLVAYISWKFLSAKIRKAKPSNISVALNTFISAQNPSREDLALIVKQHRRLFGSELHEAEELLFQEKFDVTKAKEIIKKYI